MVCLSLACCCRLLSPQVKSWWSAAHSALPGCLPQALVWRGLWVAWWGWAGLAAWAGVTEHSRDKSQGQHRPEKSQGVSISFGRAVIAGQCHRVLGSCLGVLWPQSLRVLGRQEGTSSPLPGTSFLVAEKQNPCPFGCHLCHLLKTIFYLQTDLPAERLPLRAGLQKKVCMCEEIKVFSLSWLGDGSRDESCALCPTPNSWHFLVASIPGISALWAAGIRIHSADAPDNFCLMNK